MITRLIADTLPQLYAGELGPHRVEIRHGEEKLERFCAVPLSDAVQSYIDGCLRIWKRIEPLMGTDLYQVIELEWIQQKFAVHWLESQTEIREWNQIINYFRRLARRTRENQRLPKAIVVEPGIQENCSARLTDDSLFRITDWLGSSQYTYFRVDERLGIQSFEAVSMNDVSELSAYRFYPDFLHPVLGHLKDSRSVLVCTTGEGDFLIANKQGVLASHRKGRWTVYDADNITAATGQVLIGSYGQDFRGEDPVCIACSLFQILFDISFKRQGGLIVIDRVENYPNYVVKGIERLPDSPLNSLFTRSSFDGLEYSIPEVRKLVELSAIDGALLLDTHGNLVQVGAIILPHPAARNSFGTRDTAGFSAAKFGGTAFKISQDGEISVFFTSPKLTGGEVHRMNFI